MRNKLYRILLVICTLLFTVKSEAAGFEIISVADLGHPDLQVGVWYPVNTPAPDKPNTEYELPVVLGGTPQNTNGGLIVISHGFGGWYAGHADTAIALADAGFIVAAPTHTGNTWSDMSSPIERWMIDRPRHVSRVLDQLLSDGQMGTLIDPAKIGVYGFSAGGYTALSLIGGLLDFGEATRHCELNPVEFVCAEGAFRGLFDAKMDELPDASWGADLRISAAVISAPGFAFAYTEESLTRVVADVQLWSGELDTSVPTETNAALLASRLPEKPETHWVEDASHFAFLTVPCREAFKQEDPAGYQEICGDPVSFDRKAFHADMHRAMIRFYNEKFSGRSVKEDSVVQD